MRCYLDKMQGKQNMSEEGFFVTHPLYVFHNFRSFVFELWADKAKLLGNMTLSAAITAFLQLCFVFNLTYPKVNFYLLYLN